MTKQRQKELPWSTLSQQRMELVLAAGPKLGPEFLLLKAILEELNADQLTRGQIPLARLLIRAGCSRATHRRRLDQLIAAGLVVAEQSAGTFRGDGLVYWIDMDALKQLAFPNPDSDDASIVTSLNLRQQLSHHETAAISPRDSSSLNLRQQVSHHETAETETAESIPLLQRSKDPSSPSPRARESEDQEREWGRLKNILNKKLKLGDPHGAIDQARANGCAPADVWPVVSYALAQPGRWQPWEIWNRVRNTFPSDDPAREAAEGWPEDAAAASAENQAPLHPPDVCTAEELLAALPFAERMELARQHLLRKGGNHFADYQRRGRDSPARWRIAEAMARELQTTEAQRK